jgi:hypothetical protein
LSPCPHLHPELLEVQVALDPPPDLIVDQVALPVVRHIVLGFFYGVTFLIRVPVRIRLLL